MKPFVDFDAYVEGAEHAGRRRSCGSEGGSGNRSQDQPTVFSGQPSASCSQYWPKAVG